MPHPSHAPRRYLVCAIAAALAVLIGIVRLDGRESPRSRASRPVEPPAPAQASSQRVPLAPEPLDTAVILAAPLAEAGSPEETPPPSSPVPGTASGSSRREPPRLTGTVVRPEGDPASEARVVFGEQHARCDAGGRFELVLTGDGPADLIAFEPGYEPALRPSVPAFGGSTHELHLVLGPSTLTLAGTVTNRAGYPLGGWTVELDGLDPLTAFGLRERVLTDADGRFHLPDVPNGIHVVRAFAERRELAFRSPPIAAGGEGIVILADPGE